MTDIPVRITYIGDPPPPPAPLPYRSYAPKGNPVVKHRKLGRSLVDTLSLLTQARPDRMLPALGTNVYNLDAFRRATLRRRAGRA